MSYEGFEQRLSDELNENPFGSDQWTGKGNSSRVEGNVEMDKFEVLKDPSYVVQAMMIGLSTKSIESITTGLDLAIQACLGDQTGYVAAELGSLGACAHMHHILMAVKDHPSASEKCLCCLWHLVALPAEPEDRSSLLSSLALSQSATKGIYQNRKRLSSVDTVSRILQCANANVNNVNALEYGLKTAYCLCFDRDNYNSLYVGGVCSLISQALLSFSTREAILLWSCKLLHRLLIGLEEIAESGRVKDKGRDYFNECQDALADKAVIQNVVQGLSQQGKDKGFRSVVVAAMFAIGALARKNRKNKMLLVEAGIAQLLESLTKSFSLRDLKLAESICWAIGNLSYPEQESQSVLGEHGACDMILTALNMHKEIVTVVQEALRALRNISHDHEENVQRLVKKQVCEVLLEVMMKYRNDKEIMQWVWYAVSSLAEHEEALIRLESLEVCSEVIESFAIFSSVAPMVQWAALAVGKLAVDRHLSTQLGEAKACQTLTQALWDHCSYGDVVEEVLGGITALSGEVLRNRVLFFQAQVYRRILKALTWHESNEIVVEAGFKAISYLIHPFHTVSVPLSTDIDSFLAVFFPVSVPFLSFDSSKQLTERFVELGDKGQILDSTYYEQWIDMINSFLSEDAAKTISRVLQKNASIETSAVLACKILCYFAGATESQGEPFIKLKLETLHEAENRLLRPRQIFATCPEQCRRLHQLGASNTAVALTAVIQLYSDSPDVIQWALLGLVLLSLLEGNLAYVKGAGGCEVVVMVLQNHFAHKNVVRLSLELIKRLCVTETCRAAINATGGDEVVLMALAHHLQSEYLASLGCEVISGLCLAPHEDAYSTTMSALALEHSVRKLQRKVSLDSGSKQSHSEVDWISFDAAHFEGSQTGSEVERGSNSVSVADIIKEKEIIEKAPAKKSWWGLFRGKGSEKTKSAPAAETTETGESGLGRQSSINMISDVFRRNTITWSSWNAPAPSAATQAMYAPQNTDPSASTGFLVQFDKLQKKMIKYHMQHHPSSESESIIRTTTVEDPRDAQFGSPTAMNLTNRVVVQKKLSSCARLVNNGATALLVTLLQQHQHSDAVQLGVLNTLISLSFDPAVRKHLNRESLFDLIQNVYERCLTNDSTDSLQRKTKALKQPTDQVPESELDMTALSNLTSQSVSLSLHQPDQDLEPITSIVNPRTLVATPADIGRSVVLLMVNITIGSICLPVQASNTTLNPFSHPSGLVKVSTSTSMNPVENNPLSPYTPSVKFNKLRTFDPRQYGLVDAVALAQQEYFGTSGTCVLVLQCGATYLQEPLVCEATVRALALLSNGHLANQHIMGKAGASDLIIRIFRRHFDNPRIAFYCALAISSLVAGNDRNAERMDKCQVCEVLAHAIALHLKITSVVESCARAVSDLYTLNESLAKAGVCKELLIACKTHFSDSLIVQWICSALSSLAESDAGGHKEQMLKFGACEMIPAALTRHACGEGLLTTVFSGENPVGPLVGIWGTSALYFMTKGVNNNKLRVRVLAAGGADAVAKVLLRHSGREDCVTCCCRALVVLLMENEIGRTRVGGMGVITALVECLHTFPSSEKLAKWGLRLMAILAEAHEANISRLGVSGACEAIPLVMAAHPMAATVAGAGCDCLLFLGENLSNGLAERCGKVGACESIVSTLKNHGENAVVAGRASAALASLARIEGNANWFGPAGACEALLKVIKWHRETDVDVCRSAVTAVGNLCYVARVRERLGTIGMCEAVVNLVTTGDPYADKHIQDSEAAKAVAICITRLCEPIEWGHKTGPLPLVLETPNTTVETSTDTSVLPSVRSSERLAGSTSKVHEVDSFADFSQRHEDRRRKLGDAPVTVENELALELDSPRGTSLSVRGSIESKEGLTGVGPDSVKKEDLTPVEQDSEGAKQQEDEIIPPNEIPKDSHHLMLGNRNRAALYRAGYCRALMELLIGHLPEPRTTPVFCRAIFQISYGDTCTVERALFGSLGACQAVMQAMIFHSEDEEVMKCCCWAIKALAYSNFANQNLLKDCGACASVVYILREFRYASSAASIAEAASWAICDLSEGNDSVKEGLGKAGVCEGLLEVMELLGKNPEVCKVATRALFTVCDGNEDNRLRVSFAGAADILVGILQKHGEDEQLLVYVYSTMISMCQGKMGQSRLGEVGACRLVLSSLQYFEKRGRYTVTICLCLIAALGWNNNQNQKKLVVNGACKTLGLILSKHLGMLINSYQRDSKSAEAYLHSSNPPTLEEFGIQSADLKSAWDLDKMVTERLNTESQSNNPCLTLEQMLAGPSVMRECCRAVVSLLRNSAGSLAVQKFKQLAYLEIPDTIRKILTSKLAVSLPPMTVLWMRLVLDLLNATKK